jgi:hypothetical protein
LKRLDKRFALTFRHSDKEPSGQRIETPVHYNTGPSPLLLASSPFRTASTFDPSVG